MEPNQMNGAPKKGVWPWVILVLLLIAAGVYFLLQSSASENNAKTNNEQTHNTDDMNDAVDTIPDQAATDTTNSTGTKATIDTDISVGTQVKTMNVATGLYSFDPSEIRVKKGDRVRIVFTNTKGSHNWKLDEFNADTGLLEEDGATKTIEFTADKVGTFEYYCDFEDHREKGMVGKFIVE